VLFNSFHFLVFLTASSVAFYSVAERYKQLVIFLFSVVFIAAISSKLVIFTLIFTILNYILGIFLEKKLHSPYRLLIFRLSVMANAGLLVFFKYYGFLADNLNSLFGGFNAGLSFPHMNVLLPVGISYYTFQVIGYLVRINRAAEKAEHNFIHFANYLIFFPKFISGPIERSQRFFPQLNKKTTFVPDEISKGLRLFLLGMFKKVVIANNLAGPVVAAYDHINTFPQGAFVFVFIIQAIHLYCDFSGYTDMALGMARIFGIKLTDNFNRPFLACSVSEFWRRWHISLSSWCNDFVFLPFIIQYRRLGNVANVAGIFLTFFIIGVWHGANWTFVVLGLLQGVAISAEFATKRKRVMFAQKFNPQLVVLLSRIYTFLFFCFTLVFFNARNMSDAWYFISHLFVLPDLSQLSTVLIELPARVYMAVCFYLILFVFELYQENGADTGWLFQRMPRLVRWAGYYIMLAFIFFYSSAGDTFIYLKF